MTKETILKNGGATLTPSGNPTHAKNGYMVSIEGFEKKLTIEEFKTYDLSPYFELAKLGKRAKTYVGIWVDQETSIVYVDLSGRVPTLERAKELAKQWKQLAIWDIKNSKEVRI